MLKSTSVVFWHVLSGHFTQSLHIMAIFVLTHFLCVQEFSQKGVGWQLLPSQLFTASDIPLRVVDFSHNSMRRLSERMLDGMEDTLEEIYLGHNLLGDNLSPVFTTSEFQNLKNLRVLDLSYNGMVGVQDNIISGCEKLKVRAQFLFRYNPESLLSRF